MLVDIKQDLGLLQIPVVVLTTSTAEDDILDTYSLHADLYVSKPMDVSRFGEVIAALDHLFASVRVPTD